MAANALLQPPRTRNHRLLKIDTKPGKLYRTYYVAHCTCDWKMSAGVPAQDHAERAHADHVAECIAEDERAEQLASLGQAMEEFLVKVGECETAWSAEDRIDAAVRYGR